MTRDRQCRAARWTAVLSASMVALALAAGARAAVPSPPFGEVVEVEVVDLALVATDGQGKPVTDLTADELAVYDDGVRVKIDELVFLGRAGGAGAGGGSAADAGAAEPLHLAILLDEVHVGASSRLLLLDQLARVMREQLGPRDRVMVAVYDGSTRVVLPFTTDRKALSAAFEAIEGVSTARLLVEQDRRSTIESIVLDSEGGHGWCPCLHIAEFVDSFSERESQRVERAASALGVFADGLSGIRGRKMIVHVSDGIPLRPGYEEADLALRLCNGAAASQGEGGTDSTAFGPEVYGPEQRRLDAERYDSSKSWLEAAARASASEVTIYPIQAGRSGETRVPIAETAPGRNITISSTVHSDNLQETLFMLADRTGGRALLGGGDIVADLKAALAEQQGGYALAYTPPASAENALHRVRIESTRPGLSLRYRTLYRRRSVDEQIAGQLLARLLYGEPDETRRSGLELVSVTPGSHGAVKARFRLAVPFASLSLVDREQLRVGAFSVSLAVADDQGRSSPVRRTVVPVRVAPAAPQEEFDWEVEIAVRPGRQRVGLALRDEVGGELSFLVREFVVGTPRK